MPISITSQYTQAAAWLSWIAYLGDDSDPVQQQKCISDALTQKIPATANGSYTLVWGPAPQDGFLVYVAQSTVDGSYAVGCRGTLSDTDPQGFFTNVIADTGFFVAEQWQYPQVSSQGASGYYTLGMQFAFDSVTTATDPTTNATMLAFFQNQGNGLDIMVAGHSLGGAIANLVAVYLADQLKATVAPFTFAAPTVTNDSWGTDIFNSLIQTSYQCVNSFDVVPMAYSLDTMVDIELTYLYPGEEMLLYDETIAGVVAAAMGLLLVEQKKIGPQYNYTPVAGQVTFNGTLGANPPYTWTDEAYRQHSLVGSYFPYLGLPAPNEDGACEKKQMGINRPKDLPMIGKEGVVFKNTKGKKFRIVKVEE